jgi:hypothetical protein
MDVEGRLRGEFSTTISHVTRLLDPGYNGSIEEYGTIIHGK